MANNKLKKYIKKKPKIIMVGPHFERQGGISRVLKNWYQGNFFNDFRIHFISTGPLENRFGFFVLIHSLIEFISYCLFKDNKIYIHTASKRSFYRKSLFLILGLLFRKKIILHIHPYYFCRFINNFGKLKKKLIFPILNKVEAFVVLTPGIKQQLHCIFPLKRIYVLNNPVNFNRIANFKNSKRFDNRLLFLGWYNKAKGVYDLVDAIKILINKGIDIYLEFYGTKEIMELKRYVHNYQLENRISVNEWINDEKKLDKLYQATMLILPSYTEGVPNVILEAMAARTPIVSTSVGGLTDILRDRENSIIVEPKNPKDLSDKIFLGLNNKDLRTDISNVAFEEAKQKYDLHVVKEKLKDILEAIV